VPAGAPILIADDEPDLRRLIAGLLERAGHRAIEAPDGRAALRLLYERRPALVILDVTMPDLDGWQALERIREMSDVPVLMLSARGDEHDRVRGLRAGADDYLPKPFGRQELLARVEALLRRARGTCDPLTPYRDEFVEVDFAQRVARVRGELVSLTPAEFRLLSAFVRHPGQLLSRDQLLELAWGDAFARTGDEVKLYVGYLRRKLGGAVGDGAAIETVRGFDYRYRPPP
jgi:DNA-binding response OmpR family regulator